MALGHRRLSIIDVGASGDQPMSYASRWWITYNGELYNYIELRAELAAAGFSFTTSSDTEVVLAAYAKWGSACLGRFIGMFAFVIYDTATAMAFAARDRFGIKPLYFHFGGSFVAFGSEIKQLLELPGVSRRINPTAAFDFLTASMTDHSPATMFESVGQLRGGESVAFECSPAGLKSPDVQRWYELPEPGSLGLQFADAADRFRELLDDAVRLHLRSDVRVGSCLSGGLDSSSIVCLAARHLASGGDSAAFTTVNARFAEKEVDEARFADSVTRATGLAAASVTPRPADLAAAAERLAWHQDEPFGGTSVFAQYCVFAEARRLGVKVMLDGQGADEQLAGYHWMFPQYYRQLIRGGHGLTLARTLVDRRRLHGVSLAATVQSLALAALPASAASRLSARRRRTGEFDWLAGDFRRPFAERSPFYAAIGQDGMRSVDGLGQMCAAQVRSTNLPTLLRYEDRSSMAHGIEARVPFLDHRLVEFTIGLGDRHKMKGAETKSILRSAMAGILPEDVRTRQDKLGFATPEQRWLSGPLRPFLAEKVARAGERFPAVFDRPRLTAMADAVAAGTRTPDAALWRIASFGIWGEVFKVAA